MIFATTTLKNTVAKRVEVYATAKAKHPERWSGDTRNWTPIAAVTLNPDKPVREKVREAA